MSNIRYVYFIKPVGAEGPVKIGCSQVPQSRLENLATWAPEPLEVAVAIPGDFDLERKIHNHFGDLHSHREWFRADARITDLINRLKAGDDVSAIIDLESVAYTLSKKAKHWAQFPENRRRASYAHRLSWAARKHPDFVDLPDDVERIMVLWRGYGWFGDTRWSAEPIQPTEAEIARLDEVLANPAQHLIVRQRAAA